MKKVKKSERMGVVLEMAEKDVDDAAESFQKAEQYYQQEVQKLEMLKNYYREYELGFEASNKVTSGEEIARQRYFLAQLIEAKEKQILVIKQCEVVVEKKKEIWQQAYVKNSSLNDLVARMREDEQRVLTKQEEKVLDEWFQQAAQTPPAYQ